MGCCTVPDPSTAPAGVTIDYHHSRAIPALRIRYTTWPQEMRRTYHCQSRRYPLLSIAAKTERTTQGAGLSLTEWRRSLASTWESNRLRFLFYHHYRCTCRITPFKTCPVQRQSTRNGKRKPLENACLFAASHPRRRTCLRSLMRFYLLVR